MADQVRQEATAVKESLPSSPSRSNTADVKKPKKPLSQLNGGLASKSREHEEQASPLARRPRKGPSASCIEHPPFLALDFETANGSPESACAIGLALVENGEIVRSYQQLIRPPTDEFSEWNFRVHGIAWEMVRNEPDFQKVWASLAADVERAEFLVAHNAGFDEGVIEACCEHYDLPAPEKPFVCTIKVASSMWEIDSYGLSRVAQFLRIPLKHHQAKSDAEAAARIMVMALSDGYRLNGTRELSGVEEWESKHLSAEVVSLVAAIMEDGKVEQSEVYALAENLRRNPKAALVWPGSELTRVADEILADGVIEDNELDRLHDLCTAILGLKARKAPRRPRKKPGTVSVCLTGFGGQKDSLREQAESAGFHVAGSITKTLDLLVIGSAPGPSKLKLATERGVRVVSFEEWTAMLAGATSVA